MTMGFTPPTGLLNTASYPTTPVSETAARQQFMDLLYQLRDYINKENSNLLFNPSAHLGLNGWSNISGPAWLSVFDSFAGGGWFQSPNSAGGVLQVLESVKIPVVAGMTITSSGDIDSSHLTAGVATIEIHAFSSSDVILGSTNVASTAATLFSKYSCTLTTPANTTYIKIRLATNSASVGYGLFRKIKVENGSVATTYSDDNTLNTNQFGSILGLSQVISGGYKVQSGTINVALVANGQVASTVTFPTAFASAPIVLAGLSDVGFGGATNTTGVGSTATATTATLTAKQTGTATGSVTIIWIAIGT